MCRKHAKVVWHFGDIETAEFLQPDDLMQQAGAIAMPRIQSSGASFARTWCKREEELLQVVRERRGKEQLVAVIVRE